MTTRPWDVEPDPVEMERARQRDRAADEVERCRRIWHAARQARDDAYRALHETERAELLAEAGYRAACAEYDTLKG